MTYLYWLALFVVLPLLALWIWEWSYLIRYKLTLLYCVLLALIFSIPWDIWAVETQIWLFPADTNIGVWIAGLPLEQYLFMVLVTLLLSTITLILKKHFETRGIVPEYTI